MVGVKRIMTRVNGMLLLMTVSTSRLIGRLICKALPVSRNRKLLPRRAVLANRWL